MEKFVKNVRRRNPRGNAQVGKSGEMSDGGVQGNVRGRNVQRKFPSGNIQGGTTKGKCPTGQQCPGDIRGEKVQGRKCPTSASRRVAGPDRVIAVVCCSNSKRKSMRLSTGLRPAAPLRGARNRPHTSRLEPRAAL